MGISTPSSSAAQVADESISALTEAFADLTQQNEALAHLPVPFKLAPAYSQQIWHYVAAAQPGRIMPQAEHLNDTSRWGRVGGGCASAADHIRVASRAINPVVALPAR